MSEVINTLDIMSNGVEDRKRRDVTRSFASLALAIGLIMGFVLYPIIKEMLKEEPKSDKIKVEVKKVINYSQLSAPPPIDIERPEPELFKTPPKVEQKKFIQPVPKKDEDVLDEEYIPTMDELQNAQIGTVDVEGIDSVIVDIEATIEAPVVAEEAILSFVEEMPSYKGGEPALMQYLGESLKYPGIAKDLDVQGIVYVRFVVEANGAISEVSVVRGVFGALDEEAIRVIKAMPDWNPGQQNGRNVRVYYTIPIRFELR
ncbi:MAG: TonB family protein [Flavobacteriales bacterium]|nr:TonB family protein [Flavobacteriales bacterium]